MYKRLLFITFTFIVINALFWIFLVPLWHFPDEQAHFGQVAYIAETGRNPNPQDTKDLTKEIYMSEVLLGTERDELGNNKFTFHPTYKIQYNDTLYGMFEVSISAMSNSSDRDGMVKKEATRYPPLYYYPAASIYRIFFYQDLFFRAYLVRFWSLFLFLTTVFFTYRSARLLFDSDKLLTITLTLLVGFQPMMVFSNVGVNSDAMGNLMFTLFLYLAIRMIILGINIFNFLLLLSVTIISYQVKTQFMILFPIFYLLALFIFTRDTVLIKKKILFTILALAVSFFLFLYFFDIKSIGLLNQFAMFINFDSLWKFTKEYTIPHTYREVLPWYWGVYDWLGVTYPRFVHRIINWTLLVSAAGLVLFFIKIIRFGQFRSKKIQSFLFLGMTAAVYFTAISFYDWMLWYTSKYPLGVQGRYFFPVIIVHMLFLTLGWVTLFPHKIKHSAVKLLGILMILLNFYALYTVAKTYYDLSSYKLFIIQASQYKPLFVKGAGLTFILLLLIIFLIVFLIEYIKYPYEKDFKTSSQK